MFASPLQRSRQRHRQTLANTRQPAEDDQAFDDFRRLHRERLYRAVTSVTREPDTAVEAVDAAMTQAAESWAIVSNGTATAGWVYRTALRNARLRRTRLAGDGLPGDASHPDPVISDALAALPFRVRAVVVARFYLDWSPGEIATALRLPVRIVERRLNRALARLQRAVDEAR